MSTKHSCSPSSPIRHRGRGRLRCQGEDTYNWETGEWLAPVNFLVSKIVKVGGQPVSIVGGVRYWMDFPDTGPHGSGGRLGMTFLFPAR